MHPTVKAARIAGWIYLALVVTGPFSLMYVPGKLIVKGNATATAGNVLATVLRVGSAVSGQGSLLQITFKAVAPSDETAIRVLSATPSPQDAGSAKWSNLTVKIK